jgi:hypothetical protein
LQVEGFGRLRRVNFFNLRNRTFAREHGEIAAEFRANSTPAALEMVICVEAWIGKSGESADQPADADVLHNRRVHAGAK